MPLPSALASSLTDRLSGRSADAVPLPPRARTRAVVRRVAGAAARRAENWGLLSARRGAQQANVRLDGVEQTLSTLQHAAIQVELAFSHLDRLDGDVHEARETADDSGRRVGELTVNQELLKAELRGLQQVIDELGMAIAPGTGLAGAGVRLAELRERVNGLDRRIRALASAPGGAVGSASGDAAAAPAVPAAAAPDSALFDYVGFETRFRGDPDAVSQTLWERYGDRLAAHPPVVDLGCGRAELLHRLRDLGVEARGVDTDPSMVLEARDSGLAVEQADALTWLAEQPEHSLGSIIATHLVEHLQLDDLVRLLELSASRLRPGGILIAETPNPQSLIVLGNSYVMDPTHVRPIHPSLLTFLLEGAGFRDVRLEFWAPAEGYHLPLVDDPSAPAWVGTVNAGFQRLNEVLFGPQDYAAVATTAQ